MVHAAEKPADMVPGGRPSFKALFEELNRLGYIEGRNLQVLRFSAEGYQDRYAAVAREAAALQALFEDVAHVAHPTRQGLGHGVLQPLVMTSSLTASLRHLEKMGRRGSLCWRIH